MEIFEQWESGIRGYCRIYPTVFKSASNARQVDEAGKSYIDFFAGAGVLNFGHNNERMKKSLIAFIQADGIAHSLDMYTTAKRTFMEKFVNTILVPRGWSHKIQFMGPTGTNAVETALKSARKATGRRNVVAFSNGFHGMTLGALACTANSYFRNASGVPLENVIRAPFETSPGGGLAAVEAMRKQFEDPSGGLEPPAAFVLEAIQAEGGVNVASEAWLKAVQSLANDLGALFIIDDIQAGCGRTGSYFSFDGMDIDPDIVVLAKGIGGFGLPLAMNLIKPEYDQYWSPGEHTGTFRGQGLSFVAGSDALSYFEDNELMTAVRKKGSVMAKTLQTICDEHKNRSFYVRGKGMIQGIDVGDGVIAKEIVGRCFGNGLLLGACGSGGRVIKLIPPLTIPDSDLEEGLSILTNSVHSVLEAL